VQASRKFLLICPKMCELGNTGGIIRTMGARRRGKTDLSGLQGGVKLHLKTHSHSHRELRKRLEGGGVPG